MRNQTHFTTIPPTQAALFFDPFKIFNNLELATIQQTRILKYKIFQNRLAAN